MRRLLESLRGELGRVWLAAVHLRRGMLGTMGHWGMAVVMVVMVVANGVHPGGELARGMGVGGSTGRW